MFGYFVKLGLRSLRRNVVITALMIAAVGVGIGASMTVYTVMRAMSGNPIPQKSSQLFAPQIDAWGPPVRPGGGQTGVQVDSYSIPTQLTYRDAAALMRAQRAPRQLATYAISQEVTPANGREFGAGGRATSRDFFAMFDVPFRSGAVWSRDAEEKRENVVVLGADLSDRLFPHEDPVGEVINLSNHDYRIVGVIQNWSPMPHFYDMDSGRFSDAEQFFIPFTTAIDRQITSSGAENCRGSPTGGWDAHLNSDCLWVQFWAELPTAAGAGLQDVSDQLRRRTTSDWPISLAATSRVEECGGVDGLRHPGAAANSRHRLCCGRISCRVPGECCGLIVGEVREPRKRARLASRTGGFANGDLQAVRD